MNYELIQTASVYAIPIYGREKLGVERRKDARSGRSPSA